MPTLLKKMHRLRKRLNPFALQNAKIRREKRKEAREMARVQKEWREAIETMKGLIAETRAEADELERQGNPERAAKLRRFCDMHEIRIKLTLCS